MGADRRFPFLDALVLAIGAGEKDVTRRLVNMRDYDYIGPRDCEDDPASWGRSDEYGTYWYLASPSDAPGHDMRRPYYPGDTMAVCEALVPLPGMARAEPDVVGYRCDRREWEHPEDFTPPAPWLWKVRALPARYCPTWAVRYRRPILSVRPERLSWVTDDEARREGIARLGWEPTRDAFLSGFRAMHKLPDDADPWVWRVEFGHAAFEVSDAR